MVTDGDNNFKKKNNNSAAHSKFSPSSMFACRVRHAREGEKTWSEGKIPFTDFLVYNGENRENNTICKAAFQDFFPSVLGCPMV